MLPSMKQITLIKFLHFTIVLKEYKVLSDNERYASNVDLDNEDKLVKLAKSTDEQN